VYEPNKGNWKYCKINGSSSSVLRNPTKGIESWSCLHTQLNPLKLGTQQRELKVGKDAVEALKAYLNGTQQRELKVKWSLGPVEEYVYTNPTKGIERIYDIPLLTNALSMWTQQRELKDWLCWYC